jgi:hypothetical protein
MLPPRIDGQIPSLPDDVKRLVVIGANGAGKTLFTDRLCQSVDADSMRLSALDAIYTRQALDPEKSYIDRLFLASRLTDAVVDTPMSPLERILALLMNEELVNLLSYKFAVSAGEKISLASTRLDRLIALWKKVFPGGAITVSKGQFLFSGPEDDSRYSTVKLSDGERAVLYHCASVLYAPKNGTVIVDNPEIFLHPTTVKTLWDALEAERPDCRLVYTTHDPEFAASRRSASVVWVRAYDPDKAAWDYDVLEQNSSLPDEVYMSIIGARRPVLFIEGDGVHSIDSKLYPLIFNDFTVSPLGSCNRVIEATRTFNDLNSFHRMTAMGIVDRDRRDPKEVAYLRRKKIMVPEVAEIENIFMLPEVIKAVAQYLKKDGDAVFRRVSRNLIAQFSAESRAQALQHTRHQVKRRVEYHIDARFTSIATLERHLNSLTDEINPRQMYDDFCRSFRSYVKGNDYMAILKVYNQKSMISGSGVADLLGLRGKDHYISTVLNILSINCPQADRIRSAVISTLNPN